MSSKPDAPFEHDISTQLKTAAPLAPLSLRQTVRETAMRPQAPGWSARLRGLLPTSRPRLVLAGLPALVLVAAVAGAIAYHSSNSGQVTFGQPASGHLSDNAIPSNTTPPQSAATSSATIHSAQTGKAALVPVPTPGSRPQRITTELTLTVKDVSTLSRATLAAMRLTQSLGGYLGSIDYSSGNRQPQPCPYAQSASSQNGSAAIILPPCLYQERQSRAGVAILTLRVPTGKVAEALIRLSALGTISSQHLAVEDLKGTNDTLATEINRLQDRIATLRGQLQSQSPTALERQSLRAQLGDAETQLQSAQDQLSQSSQDASYATLTATLETPLIKNKTPHPAHHGRVYKALVKAVDILVWELVGVFYTVVVIVPALLLFGLAFWLWRYQRRRGNDSLLKD